MDQLVQTYPYLMMSLSLLGVFLSALAFTPRRLRHLMVLSGALAAPFALTSPLVVPSSWNPEGLWGPAVLGVPLDEVAWALAFGATWPAFAAYLLDAQLHPVGDAPPGVTPA